MSAIPLAVQEALDALRTAPPPAAEAAGGGQAGSGGGGGRGQRRGWSGQVYAPPPAPAPLSASTASQPAQATLPHRSSWGDPPSGFAQEYQQPALPSLKVPTQPLTPPLSTADSLERTTQSPSPPLLRHLPPVEQQQQQQQQQQHVQPYEPIKLERVRLWLGRLQVGTTKRDVLQLFARENIAVLDAEVRTRFEPAYAFVTVSSSADADLAILRLHQTYQLGVFLRVERALPYGTIRSGHHNLAHPVVEVHNLPSNFDNLDLLTLARRFAHDPKNVVCQAGGATCEGHFTVEDAQAARAAVNGLNAAVVQGMRVRASCRALADEAEEGEVKPLPTGPAADRYGRRDSGWWGGSGGRRSASPRRQSEKAYTVDDVLNRPGPPAFPEPPLTNQYQPYPPTAPQGLPFQQTSFAVPPRSIFPHSYDSTSSGTSAPYPQQSHNKPSYPPTGYYPSANPYPPPFPPHLAHSQLPYPYPPSYAYPSLPAPAYPPPYAYQYPPAPLPYPPHAPSYGSAPTPAPSNWNNRAEEELERGRWNDGRYCSKEER